MYLTLQLSDAYVTINNLTKSIENTQVEIEVIQSSLQIAKTRLDQIDDAYFVAMNQLQTIYLFRSQ